MNKTFLIILVIGFLFALVSRSGLPEGVFVKIERFRQEIGLRMAKGAQRVEEKQKLSAIPAEAAVTLHLKNGSSISGKLISEEAGTVSILWKEGIVRFSRDEILSIERGEEGERSLDGEK